MKTKRENAITLETALGSNYSKEEKGLAVFTLIDCYRGIEDKSVSYELVHFAMSFFEKKRTPLSISSVQALHDYAHVVRADFSRGRYEVRPSAGYAVLARLVGHKNHLFKFFYTKAADLGGAKACYSLSLCYLKGELGYPKDLKKAKHYSKKAIRLGYVDAYLVLGLIAGEGRVTEKSIPYLEEGTKKGGGNTANVLGEYYESLGDEESLQKAIFYFAKSAERNDPTGTYGFAKTYALKKYHRVDKDKTKAYLEKASDLGNSDADYVLGMCYQEGKFGKKDFDLAEKYFRRGMENDDARCGFALARLQGFFDEKGRHIEKRYPLSGEDSKA